MTSELDRGVYYSKYYGRGGGGCQVAAGCKKNVARMLQYFLQILQQTCQQKTTILPAVYT